MTKLKLQLEFEITNEYLVDIELIQIFRKDVTKLLYNKSIGDLSLTSLEEKELVNMIKGNSNLKLLFTLITDFRILLFSKDKEKLTKWINEVELSSFKKLKSFVGGLKKDIEAVNNSITTNISNGMIEGKVNKLKKIKRDMYGRASFNLLRIKIFLNENQLN